MTDTTWKVISGILALVVIALLINGFGKTATTTQPTEEQDQFTTINVDMKALAEEDAVLGDANAPVTIVEFSDYQCPYCGRFNLQTYPSIKDSYIKTGKVRLIFRDFPLGFHENAQKAAEAAECAGEQNKYYEMSEKIFANQAAITVDDLKKYAASLGLDAAKFNDCLDSGKMVGEIAKDLKEASAVGIQGTPGFIIGKTNGKTAQVISGAYPFSAFQQVIDAALK